MQQVNLQMWIFECTSDFAIVSLCDQRCIKEACLSVCLSVQGLAEKTTGKISTKFDMDLPPGPCGCYPTTIWGVNPQRRAKILENLKNLKSSLFAWNKK